LPENGLPGFFKMPLIKLIPQDVVGVRITIITLKISEIKENKKFLTNYEHFC
jgi:hypothetical protein